MKWFLTSLIVALLIVHHDFWNWNQVEPLAGGFIPVGLWYQALFCVAASVVLGLCVLLAWPKHLEGAEPETAEARQAELGSGH